MAKRSEGEESAEIPRWSWIAATIGLVLVVGSAGFMLYRAFTVEYSPPDLVIETEPIVPCASGYLVPFRVTNQGGSAAAGLAVEGTLGEGTAAAETSEITIDYVPSGSERGAGLFFSNDPRKGDLQIRVKGYQQP